MGRRAPGPRQRVTEARRALLVAMGRGGLGGPAARVPRPGHSGRVIRPRSCHSAFWCPHCVGGAE